MAAASNDRRCINYCRAGVRLAALTATAVCGRDVRTADACERRSARILVIRGLKRTARPLTSGDSGTFFLSGAVLAGAVQTVNRHHFLVSQVKSSQVNAVDGRRLF